MRNRISSVSFCDTQMTLIYETLVEKRQRLNGTPNRKTRQINNNHAEILELDAIIRKFQDAALVCLPQGKFNVSKNALYEPR
jgi:hypothetical protein